MREAHVHIAALGESLVMPRLDDCRDGRECLARVRTAAAATRPGCWVRLTNARPEGWPEGRWPTLRELDEACPDKPCVVLSFDYHAAAVNSAALRAAGLRAGERVGVNGEVRVDELTGDPTGLLLEDAAQQAWRSAPEPDESQRRGFVKAGIDRLAALGFTQVHDLHSSEWLGFVLAELEHAGQLPLNVRVYPNVRSLRSVWKGKGAWESDRVRLAGGKVFADGTLNSRTALVLEPFRDPLDSESAHGRAMVTVQDLRDALALTEGLGLHLATHAIGDGAVRMVLDAIESGSTRKKPAGPANAHRIEHCELIDASDVPRFAKLGVVCSVQPCHLLTDIEVLSRQLPGRLDRVLPLRELIDSECAPGRWLWFGSDAPIVRPEPADSVQAAVARRRPGAPQSEAIGWSQRISEAEAWACFQAMGEQEETCTSRTAAHTR